MRSRRGRLAIAMLILFAAAMLAGGVACSDDNGGSGPSRTVPAATPRPTRTPLPGVSERATLRGTLTVDGAPLETEFLGARIVRDGLPAACQGDIPAVTGGEYEISVVADAEQRGCGAAGARVYLWAYVGDQFLYSNETVDWPGAGANAEFDATFSAANPLGASTPVTGLKGKLFDSAGNQVFDGAVIEAFVGDTLCGVTSMRHGESTEGYYTLSVAGPAAVPACADGATIRFHVDGQPVPQTAVHDLGRGSEEEHEVDLTLP